jgi:hypothetical protein
MNKLVAGLIAGLFATASFAQMGFGSTAKSDKGEVNQTSATPGATASTPVTDNASEIHSNPASTPSAASTATASETQAATPATSQSSAHKNKKSHKNKKAHKDSKKSKQQVEKDASANEGAYSASQDTAKGSME